MLFCEQHFFIRYLVCCLFLAIFTEKTFGFGGFNAVVFHLPEFQVKGSGFQFNKESPPSLEATSFALFLSSLYGLRDKINTANVSSFVASLQNSDNGYSNVKGGPSSLQSTFYALLILHHLGTPSSNPTSIGSYIRSLYDSESKLYANRPGEKGTIKSTALALQSLELLSELNRGSILETIEEIRKTLQSKVKIGSSGEIFFSFSEDENTIDNAYGIIAASYVGFPFENVEAWAKFFTARQILSGKNRGGFFVNKERTNASIESTAMAITSLYYLQKSSHSDKDLVNLVDTEALLEYAKSVPYDLRAVALAHAAVARTNMFQKFFFVSPSYEIFDNRVGIVENRIIEGTQLKPVLNVKTLYGATHAGLSIEATITHIHSNEQVNRALKWNADTSLYTTEEFYDTTDKLGPLKITYHIRLVVVDLNQQIHFTIIDEKTVGYSIHIRSLATLAGKEIEPLEIVGVGTEFKFDVSLSTVNKAELTSGDFLLEFLVLDSSAVTVYFQTIDGHSNTGRLSFAYTLSKADLPSGDLTFRFEVKNSHSVHTVAEVRYVLSIPMVATEITFEGVSSKPPTYKIGDRVKVTITPASLRDLRSVVPYPSKDAHKKDIGDQRQFFLDVFSQGGTLLFTIRGRHFSKSDGTLQYRFDFEVENTFDVIGTNIIVFRYMGANGQNITLQNYNSQQNELFEESESLTYVVNTELELDSFEGAPNNTDLSYGDQISLRFKVRDRISGKQVVAKPDSEATVYLVLRHVDAKGRQSVSARQVAVQIEDKDGPTFVIEWSVNPNAVKGKSQLALQAVGSDATPLKLINKRDGKEWQININIGGEIEVKEKNYLIEDFGKVNFLIEFELHCRNRLLKGAQLRATVLHVDPKGETKELFTIPVARHDTSGKYSISWQLESRRAPAGKYQVNVYREIDRARTVAEKKKGERMDESSLALEPLVTFTFEHTPQGFSLPMRTEFLVVILLGTAYFTLSYRKMEYESKK